MIHTNIITISKLAFSNDNQNLFLFIIAHRKDIHWSGKYDESSRVSPITTEKYLLSHLQLLVAICTSITCSVMSESFSIERRKLMRFLGAKVILTNPAHKATGMIIKAKGEREEMFTYSFYSLPLLTLPFFLSLSFSLFFSYKHYIELADKHGWFWPNQFENKANAWIHRETTGPEIVNAFRDVGKSLDHFGK